MTPDEKEALVVAHMSIVDNIVRKRCPPATRDDARQVGYLALWRAADSYDPAKCPHFGPYAAQTVIGQLKRDWYANRCVGHVPNWIAEVFRDIERSSPRATTSAVEERLASLGEPKSGPQWGALAYFTWKYGEVSLDEPVSEGDGVSTASQTTRLDRVADDGPTPEENERRMTRIANARRLLRETELTEQERRVLAERFAPDDDPTFLEIGKRLALSGERVRQVEAGALEKLRRTAKRCGVTA